ncbi:MAG: hypothetical protein ABFC34_16015 [Methanobacterium sp.]
MDRTERYFKISLDILLFILLYFIINQLVGKLESIILAIILAHTLNWIFNGQIFVLLKNLNLLETSKGSFIEYLDNIEVRLKNENCIIAAAAFGSISREKLKSTSDLDIRIIRKPGIRNAIKACIFLLKERTLSFFKFFPLDIYVLDDFDMISEHIKNEKPIVIFDPEKIFEKTNLRN